MKKSKYPAKRRISRPRKVFADIHPKLETTVKIIKILPTFDTEEIHPCEYVDSNSEEFKHKIHTATSAEEFFKIAKFATPSKVPKSEYVKHSLEFLNVNIPKQIDTILAGESVSAFIKDRIKYWNSSMEFVTDDLVNGKRIHYKDLGALRKSILVTGKFPIKIELADKLLQQFYCENRAIVLLTDLSIKEDPKLFEDNILLKSSLQTKSLFLYGVRLDPCLLRTEIGHWFLSHFPCFNLKEVHQLGSAIERSGLEKVTERQQNIAMRRILLILKSIEPSVMSLNDPQLHEFIEKQGYWKNSKHSLVTLTRARQAIFGKAPTNPS